MSNNGIVKIHGKDYMTVAGRLELAKDDLVKVETEVLQHDPVVVIKAIITTKKGTFTGISSANPAKAIEKSNPYEVAETSAVGRALGFAGYGVIEGIASVDEMVKAGATKDEPQEEELKICSTHETNMYKGHSESKNKDYWYHRNAEKQICFGQGYKE